MRSPAAHGSAGRDARSTSSERRSSGHVRGVADGQGAGRLGFGTHDTESESEEHERLSPSHGAVRTMA